ncbi:MAG: TRAP transporter large permease [Gemmatimonadota bacterium]
MTAILLGSFLVLLLLGVPIAFCMVLASLAAILYVGIDPIIVGLETTRSLSSFYAFLAVPFFILAGEIMSQGGLSERLINFVKSLVGHRRAGLPFVTVLSSQLFGSVSGASAATCAAIGRMMIPELEKNGYPRPFATALSACAGTTGALIPPSIALIIYGTVANVSIEQLFMGGVLPGVLIGVGLMLVSSWMSKRYDVKLEPRASMAEVLHHTKQSLGVLLLAIIILAGIMAGVFTATEASSVAVVYALFVSLVVYRRLRLGDLPALFVSAAKTTAALSFVLACASLFAWTMGIGKVPEVVTAALLNGTDSLLATFGGGLSPESLAIVHRVLILLVINVALLLIGTMLDAAPALLIVVPVLLPVADAIGMGEGLAAVHFGVLVVSNLVIGLITPPVGTTLFVAAGVGGVEVSQLVPHVLRFLVSMVIVQILITFVPFVTTALPSLMN